MAFKETPFHGASLEPGDLGREGVKFVFCSKSFDDLRVLVEVIILIILY